MADILLIEDDVNLNKGICIALERDGHSVDGIFTYADAQIRLAKSCYDMLLLDINLPDGNGITICENVRSKSDLPVIFITAKDTEEEMLLGFGVGCDDYIAKPFSVPVLRRKVMAVLKRSYGDSATRNVLKEGELVIDIAEKCVRKNGRDCGLTATEYKLIEYMARNRGITLTRDMILARVFDEEENYIDSNTLNVYIQRLRKKIETYPSSPEYINTVFGIGYTFGIKSKCEDNG